LLKKIQKEAASAKGEVVRLCGNHELMLLQCCFKYVNFKNPESFADELKQEILRGDVRASYTDGKRLYTHAGLRSDIWETLIGEMKPIESRLTAQETNLSSLSDHINRVFRESVANNDLTLHPIFHRGRDREGSDPVGGIFWCDFSAISSSLEACETPQIFGHTPTRKNGVKTAHALKLINIDAGMCLAYGGRRVYLEITSSGHLVQQSKAWGKWRTMLLGTGEKHGET
jgi:hypothetical protein